MIWPAHMKAFWAPLSSKFLPCSELDGELSEESGVHTGFSVSGWILTKSEGKWLDINGEIKGVRHSMGGLEACSPRTLALRDHFWCNLKVSWGDTHLCTWMNAHTHHCPTKQFPGLYKLQIMYTTLCLHTLLCISDQLSCTKRTELKSTIHHRGLE